MALGALATMVAGNALGMAAGDALMGGAASDDVVDQAVGGLTFSRTETGLDPAQLQQILDDLSNAEGIARGDITGSLQDAMSTLQSVDERMQGLQGPATEANTAALQQLMAMSGLGGQSSEDILARLQATPGFQFRQQQGQQAVERSAASRGLLESGAVLKDLTSFGQGLAEQSFGAEQSRLLGLANATSNQALAGQSGTQAIGQAQAQAQLGAGKDLANLATGSAQQRASALGQGGKRTTNTSQFNITPGAGLDVKDLLNEVPSFGGFVRPEESSIRNPFSNPLG